MFVATFWRNTLLAEAIHNKLKEHFKERVAKTIIGYSVKIDEAQSHGQTIWEYDPESKGALMIGSLAEEIYRKK
jgi:chromosome partitioning protein